MPSTLRVNVVAKDANQYVQRNTDDVLNSNFGRHSTVDLSTAAYTATWPTTGETLLYMRLPIGATAYTLNFATTVGDVGWTVSVPVGTAGFVPVILPKPQTATYILTSSLAVTITKVYV